MKWISGGIAASMLMLSIAALAKEAPGHGPDTAQLVSQQRAALDANTRGKGFGPQSPRDIDARQGDNPLHFALAPPASQMNLCNIHFHAGAEHKGGEFTRYAGPGDGQGYGSGFQYGGELSASELAPIPEGVCASDHGNLRPGDTIEVHYVYSTAQVQPGPTLGACLNDAVKNPQLRVEAQVYVLVNDKHAADFALLTEFGEKNGRYQALNIPAKTGKPVEYIGSTTGPAYNQTGSPFQVSWRVRPRVLKVNIDTVGAWCQQNVFNEDHAHGVRNLVVNPALLSIIAK